MLHYALLNSYFLFLEEKLLSSFLWRILTSLSVLLHRIHHTFVLHIICWFFVLKTELWIKYLIVIVISLFRELESLQIMNYWKWNQKRLTTPNHGDNQISLSDRSSDQPVKFSEETSLHYQFFSIVFIKFLDYISCWTFMLS